MLGIKTLTTSLPDHQKLTWFSYQTAALYAVTCFVKNCVLSFLEVRIYYMFRTITSVAKRSSKFSLKKEALYLGDIAWGMPVALNIACPKCHIK